MLGRSMLDGKKLNGHNRRSLGALALWYFACAGAGLLVVFAGATLVAVTGARDRPTALNPMTLAYFLCLGTMAAFALSATWTRHVRNRISALKGNRGSADDAIRDRYSREAAEIMARFRARLDELETSAQEEMSAIKAAYATELREVAAERHGEMLKRPPGRAKRLEPTAKSAKQ